MNFDFKGPVNVLICIVLAVGAACAVALAYTFLLGFFHLQPMSTESRICAFTLLILGTHLYLHGCYRLFTR